MPFTLPRGVILTCAFVLASAPTILGQHDMGPEVPPGFDTPMPLYAHGLGSFGRVVSTSNSEAQAFFNQGYELMVAFDKTTAIRSFREATKRDPDCAMCYWGEAWAWGSYLNAPMSASDSPFAYAASRRAAALAPAHATPVERALIEAIGVRYAERFDAAPQRTRDVAYAEAMRGASARFPDDLDVATLYAESLFLLEPRRGARDINTPEVQRLLGVLESVLARDIHHVGACHLYIHATEATTKPGLAEACAEFIGSSIPGASHINHMPSHTWNGVGRWGDSVRANIEAWHSDLKAAIGEGFAIYPTHNLHMLAFAASMDGQGAIAMQAGKDYTKLAGSSMFQVLTTVRFGRFDEMAAIGPRPQFEIDAGVWDFGQGYAQLRLGDLPAARASLARLLDLSEKSQAVFRFHSAHDLLGALAGILEGEIWRTDGDLSKAIASLERAVSREDAMIYDEPEPLPFSARHWLGAALLEAKRFSDAEAVYRKELEKHPNNGWSLFGLKAALDGQARPSSDVEREFEASWARSDTWIRASRF